MGGSMQSSIWFILLLPVAFVGLALIAVIASQVRKYACYRHELEFKRDLVERGLSIDEIERVVAAKTSPEIK
jgi:hypothetical protein